MHLSALDNLFIGFINKWIINFIMGIINYFTGSYANVLSQAGTILSDPNVRTVMFAIQALALTVLAVRVGYEILHTYILHMAGDGTADPKGVLFRTAKAAAYIMGVPWVIGWVFQLCITMANDMGTIGTLNAASDPFTTAASTLVGGEIVFALLLLVAFVIYILIFFQMACRAVEIAVLAMAGPLMAVGFVSPSEGLGAVWWRELMVQCMAMPLQILMLRLSLLAMGNATVNLGGITVFFVIGWLWTTYKCPKLLQQFAMSTGVGGAAAGVAGQMGSIAITKALM
jgi:hypothetical protein